MVSRQSKAEQRQVNYVYAATARLELFCNASRARDAAILLHRPNTGAHILGTLDARNYKQSAEIMAFFELNDDLFVGTDSSRSPWAANACHGGPVTAAIARALERISDKHQLCRLTVSFLRPIPIDGFRVQTNVTRLGRSVLTASATVNDQDCRVCAVATSTHLVIGDFPHLQTAPVQRLAFKKANPGEFPVRQAAHGRPFFGEGIEVAYPPGENNGTGPTTLWMRTLSIIAGEKPSPFQSLCPIADCGNGISRNMEFWEASCINADLTIMVYRLPESNWLASKAISYWEPTGIGFSQATLFDEQGSCGAALQTILVRPSDGCS